MTADESPRKDPLPQQQFGPLCDAITAGIVVQNRRGRIVYANQAAGNILSLSLDRLLGKSSLDSAWHAVREDGSLFPGIDHPAMVTLRTGEPQRDVVMGIYSQESDRFRWISIDSEPLLDPATGEVADVLTTFVDITERKRFEEALRFGEQRFRNLVETTTDWVWEVDSSLVYTYASPRVLTILGYEPQEILGRTPFDLMPEAEGRRVSALMAKIMESPRPFANLENVNLHKDGHLVTLDTSGAPFFDAEGGLLGFRGIDRDITRRKRAEEALRWERDFSSAIVETVGSLVVVLDREGRIVRFNRACERTTGYSFEEVKGRTIWDLLLAPEEREDVQNVFGRLLREGLHASPDAPPGHYENFWISKGGERRLIAWSNTVLIGPADTVEYVIATGIDMTEHKRANEALQRSEAFLRLLTDAVPVLIAYVDTERRFRFLNKRYEEWFHRPRHEMTDRHVSEILGAEIYRKARPRIEIALEGRNVNYEITIERPDGEKRHVRIAYLPNFDEQRRVLGYFSMVEDITDQKTLEEQLRQSQKMEAVGTLAGGIAHDFNNLLTVITGACDLVLEQLSPLDPLSRDVEEIKKAGERAATLTRQLLAFSRKQILQPKVIGLNSVVAELEKMLSRLIGEAIELKIVLDPSLKPVKADPGQMQQIVINLVVNAHDAMPHGGKLLIETANARLDEAYVRQHTDIQPGEYVMLVVSDTGVGMDEETKSHLFEPFFTTKAVGRGTGLGLSTVYGIVKQSGGHIWFYSEPDIGTTFKIYLPVVPADPEVETAPARAGSPASGSETILLVEDDPALRKFERDALSRRGYTVFDCSDGEQALETARLHAGPIHLLLTDVVMPRMSGRELARRMSELRPDAKVLYVSGYTDSAIVHHGVLDPSVAFLQKPFAPDALVDMVRRLLETGREKRDK